MPVPLRRRRHTLKSVSMTTDDLEPIEELESERHVMPVRRSVDATVVALFLIAMALAVLAMNSFQSVRLQRRADCLLEAALKYELLETKTTGQQRFADGSPERTDLLKSRIACLR